MKKSLVAAAILTVATIYAAGLPKMPNLREGLWSVHNQIIQHPSEQKTEAMGTICQKAGWNNQPIKINVPRGKCKSAVESSGTTQKYEIACKVEEVVFKLTQTREINGDNMGRTVVDTTYYPPVEGVTGTTMIMEGAYVSACPAGMKPGEIVKSDGIGTQPPAR